MEWYRRNHKILPPDSVIEEEEEEEEEGEPFCVHVYTSIIKGLRLRPPIHKVVYTCTRSGDLLMCTHF